MPLLLPFFKFDVQAWLSSETVTFMTNEQRGGFITLLVKAWANATCTIPGEFEQAKQLAEWKGVDTEFEMVWSCFVPLKSQEGRRYNIRLMKEWKEARAKQAWYADRAKLGADARWAGKPARRQAIDQAVTSNGGRDYRTESKEVLAFLNLKTSKHFREVEATLAPIEARLKSGVDVQACKTLIARKVRDWSTNADMAKYLRPETLFNKTKFETYLAEVTS